jgi:predicted transcriptional regulator
VAGRFETIEALPERIRIIATLRGLGYTFREIGRQLNVTPQAVSLMLSRHRRVLAKLEDSFELARLSARAVNVLGRHGVHSRQQAMDPAFLESLQRERNCGRKTREEIERWLAEGAAGNRTAGRSLPPTHPSALRYSQNN